jgi:hypothetical protein
MPPLEAKRTLVKSPPELWAEVSDAGALARHLGEFGEIRITRTQPESVVEWEGDRASGSVRLEPSGWGTRVTLTAEPAETREGSDLAIEHTGDRDARMQDLTPLRWWQRMFRRRAPERAPEAPPPPEAVPAVAEEEAVAALTGVLDTLGSANHRPFSR